MFEKRKGITPVIAIVLLLLVTVGAVGVVYTQFQNIADRTADTSYLENVDVKYTVVQRNTTNSPDTMQIVLENTGEDEYNLSDIARLEYSIPGEQTIRPVPGQDLFGQFNYDDGARTCFSKSAMQSFGPGDLASCNTGMEMPSPSDEVTVQLTKTATDSTSTIDTYNCSPSTSDSSTC
jgi:flagellin-like protein